MKSFKKYIKQYIKPYINESLLDDEEELATNDEQLIISYLTRCYQINGKTPKESNYRIENGEVIVNGNLRVIDKSIEHLTNGLFKFKYVNGSFDCMLCENLKSLEGAPQYVRSSFTCEGCKNLKSLEGGPQYVGMKPTNMSQWHMPVYECGGTSITSLKGAPKGYLIPTNWDCRGVDDDLQIRLKANDVPITTIDWGIKNLHGTVRLKNCPNLKNLNGLPQKIYGSLMIEICPNLATLKGAPQKIYGNLGIEECHSLKTFEGGPKYVSQGLNIVNCDNFEHFGNSLNPQLKYNKIYISCHNLPKFDSFEGIPDNIYRLSISSCPSLETLDGCPSILDFLSLSKCKNLKSIGNWKPSNPSTIYAIDFRMDEIRKQMKSLGLSV